MKKGDESSFEFVPVNSWTSMTEEDRQEIFAFCEGYKKFLDTAKTEREAVAAMVETFAQQGFLDFQTVISGQVSPKPGMKFYYNNRGKSLLAAVIGQEGPEAGFSIVGSHLDAPRLDWKPNPLYEESDFVYAKTHYYGGIKKYQWTAIPLALHGVVVKQDGSVVNVTIGEKEEDPVFTITDLLPHLASDQMQKTGVKLISGEQLNVTIGSIPALREEDEESCSVKKGILSLLHSRYGIRERDFASAELEVVPAFLARDIGLDRGLVGGYGQDDRVCAYTSFEAMLQLSQTPRRTAICFFSDKEEIGSVGTTGARSNLLETFVAELCYAMRPQEAPLVVTRRCLMASKMLSADVTAAFDPNYGEVSEKRNESYCGRGIAIAKYTGSRGKSGASDASAELVAEIISLFDSNNVPWQISEMGKVDQGGGGTIAQYMADLGIDVLDCGTAVLSMHAPFEVTSKADVYWTYRAYLSFFQR